MRTKNTSPKGKGSPCPKPRVNSQSVCPRDLFPDHEELCSRFAKRFYYGNKLPKNPRPSLPLTLLAVEAFTAADSGGGLEFLDMDRASEVGRSACVSPTTLLMALVYLERLSKDSPSFREGALGVKSSELLVLFLLANKFAQDDGEDCAIFNDEYANCLRLELRRLNEVELQLLTAIDWNLRISADDFYRTLSQVEQRIAWDQVKGRPDHWLTSTEALVLSQSIDWPTVLCLLDYVLKVWLICCMAYVAMVTALLATVPAKESAVFLPQLLNNCCHVDSQSPWPPGFLMETVDSKLFVTRNALSFL